MNININILLLLYYLIKKELDNKTPLYTGLPFNAHVISAPIASKIKQ